MIELPEHLILAVDHWFAQNTGLGGCSDKDVETLARIFWGVHHDGGRESVDDALMVVESFGSGVEGLNDTYARQVLLAAEVKRLRAILADRERRIESIDAKTADRDVVTVNLMRLFRLDKREAREVADFIRGVPAGHVVVPLKATAEMMDAGEKAFCKTARPGATWAEHTGEIYSAMLAARPLVGQDADARDAARYRWLRNVAVWATTDRDSVWCVTGTRHEDASPTYGDAMDAAIDAARSQEGDAK